MPVSVGIKGQLKVQGIVGMEASSQHVLGSFFFILMGQCIEKVRPVKQCTEPLFCLLSAKKLQQSHISVVNCKWL